MSLSSDLPPVFTDQERADYKRYCDEFHFLIQSKSVRRWRCGEIIADFGKRRLYRLHPKWQHPDPKNEPKLEQWSELVFKIKAQQAKRYLKVFTVLSKDWLKDRQIELKGLEQIAKAKVAVREVIQKLVGKSATTEQLKEARVQGEAAYRADEDVEEAVRRALAGEGGKPGSKPQTVDETGRQFVQALTRGGKLVRELLGYQETGQQMDPDLLDEAQTAYDEFVAGWASLMRRPAPPSPPLPPSPAPPPRRPSPPPPESGPKGTERRNTYRPQGASPTAGPEAPPEAGGGGGEGEGPDTRVSFSSKPAESHDSGDSKGPAAGTGEEPEGAKEARPQALVTTPAAAPVPEPAPYQPPDRPFVDLQGEGVLAVYAHPSLIHDMTRAERLCYRLLTFSASLTALLTEWLRLRLKEHEESFLRLQLKVIHEIQETRDFLSPFSDLLEPAIANARAAEPEDPAEPEEPADLLLEWVLHKNCDPFNEPDPNQSERILCTVLGQLPIFNQDLYELTTLRQQGGDEAGIDFCLLRRFGQLLPPFQHLILKSWAQLSKGARMAYEAEQAEEAQAAALEAVRGPRESRIIVVGAESLPPAHGFIGKTLDGRPVTFSFWEPSLTLLLGDRGKGKSHFIRVLMELMSVRPRGLSFLSRPQCPILIDSDCTQGEGRFEMLEGFFPNYDAAQLQELHQFYQTDESNVAFKRAILLCHYKQVAYYKQILAPYVERGLCILPLALGVPDLGGFAFEVMLEWAVGGDNDAVYKNLIQSLVARYGEELKLGVLVQAVEKSGLRGHTKQTVLELFKLLFDFYTETESVMQHVGECPVFTLVRGRYLPRNFVNPMQAALFNAFCRSTANGDPPRMVIFEEYAKALARNRAMQRFAMNFAEEGRHRPVSAVGGLQHLEGFARGLWGAADNQVVFGLSNPQDVKRAKVELYGMRHLKFIQMAAHNMPRGRAWIFSRRGSVPELAQGLLVDIRPTLIRAGGQTLNAEDWESGR